MGRTDQKRIDGRSRQSEKRKTVQGGPVRGWEKTDRSLGAGVCNEKIGTWAPEEHPHEIHRWKKRRIGVEERSRTSGSTHIRDMRDLGSVTPGALRRGAQSCHF